MSKVFVIQSLPIASAVLFSVAITPLFSLSEKFWIPLAALIVMETAIGLGIRQGLIRFIMLVLTISVAGLLSIAIKIPVLLIMFAIGVFATFSYLAIKESAYDYTHSLYFLTGVMFLICILFPIRDDLLLYDRLYDVSLGAVMGIVLQFFINPRQPDVEFTTSVIEIINGYIDYLRAIEHMLIQQYDALEAKVARQKVENALLTQNNFPGWVYEAGFSFSLRAGHRNFLINIDRIAQILFSLHQCARHRFTTDIIDNFQTEITAFTEQAERIMEGLITVLSLEKLPEGVDDLSHELKQIEDKFLKNKALNLELLDMQADYLYFAAIIQDFKDLRETLIKLGTAVSKKT